MQKFHYLTLNCGTSSLTWRGVVVVVVSVPLLREMVANHLLSTFRTANIYMPVQVLSINTFSRLENSVKKK